MIKTTVEQEPVLQTLVEDDGGLHFVIGITEEGFEYYVDSGLTHFFDFTGQGVPIKLTLFGNKTRDGAMAQLQPFIKKAYDDANKKKN